MANLIQTIAAAAVDEVVIDGIPQLTWRVRKVKSSDLAQAGAALLRMVTPALGKKAKELDPEDPASLHELMQGIDSAQLSKLTQYQEAIVCAGLFEVKSEDTDWEPITAVLHRKDIDHNNNRVHISELPGGAVAALFRAIENLDTDRGRAAERLASFRVRPKAAAVD